MTPVAVVFWGVSAVAVATAVMCITRRNPVASALYLISTLFCVAVLFVLLDAQFIGILQVLVYAGAIMVVFLFVIMLLNLGRGGPGDMKGPFGIAAAVLLAGLLLLQFRVLNRVLPPQEIVLPEGALVALQRERGVVGAVAGPLFGEYVIPFEITSMLLLAALVGAVVLAKRRL